MCVHVSILLCAFFFFFFGCLIYCHVQFVACTFVTCFNKDQSINQIAHVQTTADSTVESSCTKTVHGFVCIFVYLIGIPTSFY